MKALRTSSPSPNTKPSRTGSSRRKNQKTLPKLPETLAHLADEPRWVLWRFGDTPNGKGKCPKKPFNAHTGKAAYMDNPQTWGTFDDCVQRAKLWPNWFDGIGLVLQPGEVGVDLDNCIVNGELTHEAAKLVRAVTGRAFIECSVSGTGIHIIVVGSAPDSFKTDPVELYIGGSGRYFTLSGDELPGSVWPDCTAQDWIDEVFAAHAPASKQPQSAQQHSATNKQQPTVPSPDQNELELVRSKLPELLMELESNMTKQLHALLKRGEFPPRMRDMSDSGARAVVVAQLLRAPRRRYTDAEVMVLARAIWRHFNFEGAMKGHDDQLDKDVWRLVGKYRPGALPPVTRRIYRAAPEPLVYLRLLAEQAIGDTVPFSRDERATTVGTSKPTAARLEQKLVELGLIEPGTYALKGEGIKGRRGKVTITQAGWQALRATPTDDAVMGDDHAIQEQSNASFVHHNAEPDAYYLANEDIIASSNESVIFSHGTDQVTDGAPFDPVEAHAESSMPTSLDDESVILGEKASEQPNEQVNACRSQSYEMAGEANNTLFVGDGAVAYNAGDVHTPTHPRVSGHQHGDSSSLLSNPSSDDVFLSESSLGDELPDHRAVVMEALEAITARKRTAKAVWSYIDRLYPGVYNPEAVEFWRKRLRESEPYENERARLRSLSDEALITAFKAMRRQAQREGKQQGWWGWRVTAARQEMGRRKLAEPPDKIAARPSRQSDRQPNEEQPIQFALWDEIERE